MTTNKPDPALAAGVVTGDDVYAAIEAAKVDLLVAGWSVRLADAINTEVQKRTPLLDGAGPVEINEATDWLLRDIAEHYRAIGADVYAETVEALIARCVAGPVAVRHD